MNPMPEGKVWTAEELLALTPNERDEIIQAGIVTDVDSVPPHLLQQARADIRARIAETEAADAEQ